MVFWKKWKRIRTRWRNLLKLGVSNSNAGILACSRKGYWRIADSPIELYAIDTLRGFPPESSVVMNPVIAGESVIQQFILSELCYDS